MKKNYAFVFSFLLCFYHGFTQHNVLSVGSVQTLTITNGTLFSADSLVLVPSGNFTLASNALLETPVAVPGIPTNSILRVYYLNNPITFTGSLQLFYRLSELNGNTESALKYSDSTTGNWWLISASSSVNTTSHFVQLNASNEMFVAATATQVGSILPLTLLSFNGNINGANVNLSWTIDQNEEAKNFTVQCSADGQNWKELSVVPGSQVPGVYKYYYSDIDGAETTKLFRIIITSLSGKISFSPVIQITNSNTNTMYVAANKNSASIYFIGKGPQNVRVINAAGQTIYSNNTNGSRYDVNNLLPGFYFVQFELNGAILTKKFVVR